MGLESNSFFHRGILLNCVVLLSIIIVLPTSSEQDLVYAINTCFVRTTLKNVFISGLCAQSSKLSGDLVRVCYVRSYPGFIIATGNLFVCYFVRYSSKCVFVVIVKLIRSCEVIFNHCRSRHETTLEDMVRQAPNTLQVVNTELNSLLTSLSNSKLAVPVSVVYLWPCAYQDGS